MSDSHIGLTYLLIYSLLICTNFAMLKIVLEFRQKIMTPKFKRWAGEAIGLFILGLVVMMAIPRPSPLFKWFDIFYDNVGIIILVFEMFLLVYLLVMVRLEKDRAKRKIVRAFAGFYLSRYIFLFLIFALSPRIIRSFIFLLYLNLIPYLWIRFYFLKYAQAMSRLLGDRAVLEEIFKEYQISKREQDILRLILDGKSNKQIEDILFISYHTVKNHVYNIFQKLGIKTRHELIHLVTILQKK